MAILAMPSALKSAASFGYERDDFASYLVVKAEDESKIINYQADMILNNKIPGLLPFDVRRRNNEVYFYYNITSKITLLQFLNRVKIKKGQLVDIMLQITTAMLSGMNFLLYNKCFIFQENYIYVNPATCEICLVYLPIQVDTDVNKALRDFIINMVIYSADISEEDASDNYICKILNYVKCETFNVADFNRLLVRLDDEESKEIPEEGRFINAVEKPCTIKGQENAAGNPNPACSGNSIRGKGNKNKKRHGIIKLDFPFNLEIRKNRRAFIILAALQVMMVLLVLSCGSFLKSLGGDIKTSYIAIGLIIAGVEALAFKNIIGNFKTGSSDESEKAYMDADMNVSKDGSEDEGVNADADAEADTNANAGGNAYENTGWTKGTNTDVYMEEKNISLFGENTVLLVSEENKKPFLRLEGDGFVEETYINKKDFLIGRLGGQVDYIIKNNAVGKIHAQVISHEGKYYIKDFNSRNGTYVNETRIDSNIEYEIKDGDRIAFANSEHIFILK